MIRQEHHKGTAVGKQYQTRDATASTPELAIPDEVTVALAEIAESATEGLLALAVGAGLQVLGTLAVSRRFVAMTQTALAELLAADLSALDLVCLMVDGVHFGEHCCVVALGIGIDGTKHPLALVEGSTENATLARELLVGLRERGLEVTRPILCVLDGAKALRRAVLDVFDHPVHRQMPAAQAPQRPRQAARAAARPGRAAHAHRLPRRLRPGRRGPAGRAGPRARQDPPRRRRQPARGAGRDPDRAAAGRAADPGPHAALAPTPSSP